MRRSIAIAAAAVFCAGCHTQDVAPPALARPIEALPSGARAVLLAADLRNTWQRVEAHDLRSILSELPGSAPLLRDSTLIKLEAACSEFERRTGTRLHEDVVLNLVGGRAGVGLYGHRNDANDIALVGELRDPARFRAGIEALSREPLESIRVEAATFEGLAGWRVSGDRGTSVLVVERDGFVALATRDELVHAALELRGGAGNGNASALADTAIAAGLRAIGPHNIIGVAAHNGGWMAQAFTWDGTGLHFDHASSAPAAPAPALASESRRAEILRSIPDGMTFAAYARTPDLDLGGALGSALRTGIGTPTFRSISTQDNSVSTQENSIATQGNSVATQPGVWVPPFLPGEMRDWMGDEIGIAVRGVEPTQLAPVPDMALVFEVRDAAAATAGLRELEGRLASMPLGPAAAGFTDITYGGRTFRSFAQPFAERISPSWIVDGDVAILTSTRTLMQQIIDTRRTGRRNVQSDGAFRGFKAFVPDAASAIVYADDRRLHHVVQQLDDSAALWGPHVARGIQEVERWSGLLEHFPSGAAYVIRDGKTLAVRGWMTESD